MHGSLFVRQKRTSRTLSQPKFSPDMKAKELLETIQSNAIKCFDLHEGEQRHPLISAAATRWQSRWIHC